MLNENYILDIGILTSLTSQLHKDYATRCAQFESEALSASIRKLVSDVNL